MIPLSSYSRHLYKRPLSSSLSGSVIGPLAPKTESFRIGTCTRTFPHIVTTLVQPRPEWLFREPIRSISTTRPKSSAVFSNWNHRTDWQPPQQSQQAQTPITTTMTSHNAWTHGTLEEKEALLDHWLRQGEATTTTTIPMQEMFHELLDELAATTDARGPRGAEMWLCRLRDHPTTLPKVVVTTRAYQAVIQAWANSNKDKPVVIVNRAEKWLHELLELNKQHPQMEQYKPTIDLFNAFLDACTRGRLQNNKKNHQILLENAQKADSLLHHLHKEYIRLGDEATVIPNTESFNFVIRGWTRCPQHLEVIDRVLDLVRWMESYQNKDPSNNNTVTIQPNTKTYSMAIDGLVKRARLKAQICVERNDGKSFTTSTAMNGMDEMRRAESIITYMHELYEAGVPGIVPHRVPYNILISGWAGLAAYKHHRAPFHAEHVLRQMLTHRDNGFEEASPDRISFEKVMKAWANGGESNAGARARWWLGKLWTEAELQGGGDPNLIPSTCTYNIAMEASGKSDGALAAEEMLLDLGDKYRESPTPSLCPNSESFAIVINSWLRKSQLDETVDECLRSLQRAVEWLESLREVENETNLSTAPDLFRGVLQASKRCAMARPETLELAVNTFRHWKESRHPIDVHAYALLLQVGLTAFSKPADNDARTQFVDDLFHDCCDSGFVGKPFVRALMDSPVSDDSGWTLDELMATQQRLFHTWPLPISWTRNVRHPFACTDRNQLKRRPLQHSNQPPYGNDNRRRHSKFPPR